MLVSTLAVSLRVSPSGDSGLVADMLTERFGRLSFMVHAGRGRRAARRNMFQPLTLLEIDFDHRPSARLQHVRSVRMAPPYGSVPFSSGKMAVAMFLAEFLACATRGEREAGPLFGFVRQSLLWYDACAGNAPNFHLVFMIGTLRFLGFRPGIGRGGGSGYFDLQTGEYTAVKPPHPHFVGGEELRLMPLVLEADYSTMRRLAMSRQQRNRATDIILEFCRLHLPQFPRLRSIDVVRELF